MIPLLRDSLTEGNLILRIRPRLNKRCMVEKGKNRLISSLSISSRDLVLLRQLLITVRNTKEARVWDTVGGDIKQRKR